ncbi:MAG: Malto-oligosyltrehalose trehalohydrolase, partial [Geminicoccaceae bacterium]|nr:Malto-oligosyltrehalose trehalohydrolase [Geminicoccaceae bacterium]
QPEHAAWLDYVRGLLRLRHETIAPRLAAIRGGIGENALIGDRGLQVVWTLGDGARLALVANLGAEPQAGFAVPSGELIFGNRAGLLEELDQGHLPGWSVGWFLARPS